jgi:hypothetical protein
MKRVFVGSALAMAVTLGMVASAQSTGQPPTQQPPATAQSAAQQPTQTAPEQQVTIVGCVQREEDYRKANNLGKGGAVGTGAGAGDEFVLVNASISGANAPAAPTGTAGTPGGTAEGSAFELSGDKEEEVKAFVGKRVEITGKMKAAEKGATGTTGGATAGTPPTGVDVASADLKLREIDVVSVKESTTGTCPATMK